MIYLDNAATTIRKPQTVIDAVASAMCSMGNAGRGVNDASLGAARTIYEAREKLARLFHAEQPKQIAFTSNSTESLNIAVKGTLVPGDHVITTALEHNSVLRPLYELEKTGVELTILDSDRLGRINYEDFHQEIRENTKAIVCTHGSNLTGNLIDIRRVGQIAAKRGLLLIVDASQTAGVFPIDVQKMHIDILCFTGHKGLLGPQGTGGLYVRPGLAVRPFKSGGSGVQTYSKAAADYLLETGIDAVRIREQELMDRFYKGVRDIPGVTVYGDFTSMERCAIVTLNIGDYDSSEVSDELLMTYGISTRSGGHCAPLMHQALGTAEQGAVRFSFSHYNTEEEVDIAIRAVRELAPEE